MMQQKSDSCQVSLGLWRGSTDNVLPLLAAVSFQRLACSTHFRFGFARKYPTPGLVRTSLGRLGSASNF